MELLEKKQVMRELLKERRRTEVEGVKDTVAAEGRVFSEGSSCVSKLQSGG